jgi:hypothetical protein
MGDEFMEVEINSVQFVRDMEFEQIIRIGICWVCEKGFGNLLIEQSIDADFGNLWIEQSIDADGEHYYNIDNEMMSREFIKRVLCAIVDNAKLESEDA